MWFALLLLAAGGSISAVLAKNPKAGSSAKGRIIGGDDAMEERYPYAVSISNGGHSCGGSLIAPDIVLSAAHCETFGGEAHINRYDMGADSTTYERFEILDQILHPRYDYINYGYDFMLIKLGGQSSNPIVRLNRDDAVPVVGAGLTVIGWGRTSSINPNLQAEILQQATMNHLTNDECADYWGDTITPDMLCALGTTAFDCQGDSGGPLIIKGKDVSFDIQVGVVSWGPSMCVNHRAPSVYARISDQFHWIEAFVCSHSKSPPQDFNCDTTYSPSPSASPSAPTISPAPSATKALVTVVLDLDTYPFETGWFITDSEDREVVRFNPGTYKVELARVVESLYLDAEQSYALTVFDAAADGLCCKYGVGSYKLYLGNPKDGFLVISEDGDFRGYRRHKFFTSSAGLSEPPSQPIVTSGSFPLSIVVHTSDNPSRISWSLSRIDVPSRPLYAKFDSDSNTTQQSLVYQNVLVDENGLYSFVISGGRDCCISYQVFVGQTFPSVNATNPVISESWPEDRLIQTHKIIAQLPEFSAVDNSGVPEVLTLRIQFDNYPQEVGWFVKAEPTYDSATTLTTTKSDESDFVVVAFGPPAAYRSDLAELNQPITLPEIPPGFSREFLFVIHDSGGDGICCTYGDGSFSLMFAQGNNRGVLARDDFKDRERQSYRFTFTGEVPSTASTYTQANCLFTLIGTLWVMSLGII